ncbi:LysR family transcriptional regulator [Salinisphaera sp. P385]|uniref:HTH-type transcriptional regulator MetR n=1 Tax=Spectribacter acetivorans TaxID=3075603 RepID=A0ABU3BBJ4_9GAMM|nr:LysR family transcriptional regulator [Salinisphaera sp. P385]MDT0619634.1 LysR family transcriptional regulator [Salinisphaera sp. P385]
MIERTHLRILRSIERDGSLTAAAASLHLTQSALSHAIKKLEQHSGARIWERDGRRVRLTPAGEYLLNTANRLLPQLERADEVLAEYAAGEQGALRIGMECHPCYQWLLKVVEPYLQAWPGVDIDVMQQFQFGGMAALFSHDIDILVTPDPLDRPGVLFEPVFDYEQVLAVAADHRLAGRDHIKPSDLNNEVLFSYPVDADRLDIYTRFLTPARCAPRRHKNVESTDIMLQLVAAGRGVAALPRWLIAEYADKLSLEAVRLGRRGIPKQIHLGVRKGDRRNQHIEAFLRLAQTVSEFDGH